MVAPHAADYPLADGYRPGQIALDRLIEVDLEGLDDHLGLPLD